MCLLFHLLGIQDDFSNQFPRTFEGILENKGLVEGQIERVKVLIGK